MSITRSQIARQLLAEGGAPRKPFAKGGVNEADVEAGLATQTMADFSPSEGGYEDIDMGYTTGKEFKVTPTKSRFQTVKDNLTDTFITNPRMNRIKRGLLTTPGAIKSVVGLRDVPPELLETLAEDYTGVIGDQARNQKGLFSEGMVGSDISLENAASTLQGLDKLGVDLTGDIRSQVGDLSNAAFASRFGPKPKGGGGGDNETLPLKIKKPMTEAAEEERKGEFDDILKYYGAKFEDGGEVRDGYFGGSIVKGIKKGIGAVKKIVKSPVGKAALAFAAYKFGPQFLTGEGFKMGKTKSFKDLIFMGEKANVNPFRLLGLPTLLAGLTTKNPQDETILSEEDQSDPEFQKYLSFYGGPRRFAAEGGMMNPNDEMLNLSGNEMDLRGGGFVPLGEYEKKDDVPARLSKNEFVFTADAVRAAGGGSVDKGADVMYKTMKTLENKVA